MHCNLKTRAYWCLRDSTCPNSKCSTHSSSIPCLLPLTAAPGVLSTPHLLILTERRALKPGPLEISPAGPDGWNPEHSLLKQHEILMKWIPMRWYCFIFDCTVFIYFFYHLSNWIESVNWLMAILVLLLTVTLCFIAVYMSSLRGYWGPCESKIIIIRSLWQWPGTFH